MQSKAKLPKETAMISLLPYRISALFDGDEPQESEGCYNGFEEVRKSVMVNCFRYQYALRA